MKEMIPCPAKNYPGGLITYFLMKKMMFIAAIKNGILRIMTK
jgi:hypothetical protein